MPTMLKSEHQPWLQSAPTDNFDGFNRLELRRRQIVGRQCLDQLALAMNADVPPGLRGGGTPFNPLDARRWIDFVMTAPNTEWNRAVEA